MSRLYQGVKYRKLEKNKTELETDERAVWESEYIMELIKKGRNCFEDCTRREQRRLLACHLYTYPIPYEGIQHALECGEQRDVELLRDELVLSFSRDILPESIEYLKSKSNNRLLESIEILFTRTFKRTINNKFIEQMNRAEHTKAYFERLDNEGLNNEQNY